MVYVSGKQSTTGKKKRKTIPKYYYWDSRRQLFHVMKKKHGKIISYGYYPSEKSAQFVVNELIKCHWNKLYLSSIQKRLYTRISEGYL